MTSSTLLPPKFVGSLSHLPPHAPSHRSLTWWGMMGIVAIESTVFVLAIAAYLYIAYHSNPFPPHQMLPSPGWGTAFLIVLAVSFVPNMWLDKQANSEQLKSTQIGLVLMSLIGIALVVIRYFEFPALNVAWSDNAYGSIAVTILGLHTAHLLTDLVDTLVLTALMFTRHAHGRRFIDVGENAVYWNFVIFSWVPLYALLYLTPRWL